MWTFVVAGILYLLGVAVLLMVKPQLMFTPDGQWKEFGIGQNNDRYTPFPVWLFCIVWAIIAYILSVLLVEVASSQRNESSSSLRTPRKKQFAEIEENDMYDFDGDVSELPKGYYVLNKKATRLSGVPKYVFLGANEPTS